MGEDGGNQNVIEFTIILTLVGIASVLVLTSQGENIAKFFSNESSAVSQSQYKPFDQSKIGVADFQTTNTKTEPTHTEIIGGIEFDVHSDGSRSGTVGVNS